jgi:hypothetical protein
MPAEGAAKSTHREHLDVRKLLVVSFSVQI